MILDIAADLLAVVLTLTVMGAAFAGIGLIVRRAFWLSSLSWDDIFVSFWVGFGATLLFLILWNFVLPVGGIALAVVLSAGALGIALERQRWRTLFTHDPWTPNKWELLLLAAVTVWVANRGLAPFASWDGVLYHVQAIKWAKAYAVVPGIANLHGPLAFNNCSFLYDAMMDSGWWNGRGFHVANGVLLLAGALQATVGALQWLRGGRLATGRRCLSFLMLPLVLHLASDAASYSTDLPLALMVAAAITVAYSLLDTVDIRDNDDAAYHVCALALLLAAAVSIKLTAAVLAVGVLPLVILMFARHRRWHEPAMRRSLIAALAVTAVFAVAWLARGVVMSGYPFFPMTVAGFPVDWRAPAEHARAEAAYIAQTERAFTWKIVGGNWVRLMLFKDVNAVFVPGMVALTAIVAGWRRHRRLAGTLALGAASWLVLPLLIAIATWFVTAPSHRYSPPLFWSLAAVCVAESLRGIRPGSGPGPARWTATALVVVAVSPLIVESGVAVLRGDASLTEALQQGVFGIHPGESLSGMGGDVPVTTYTTRTGATLHVPARRAAPESLPNACFDAALPCTPNPAPNLQFRNPETLASGFRVDGEWQMLDWPYHWQEWFLPEWRKRNR